MDIWSLATRLLHEPAAQLSQLPAMPSIHPTVGFRFEDYAHAQRVFAGNSAGLVGARAAAPTAQNVERRLALMDGAEAALMLPSGMAAVTASLIGFAKAGDNVIVDHCGYVGTQNLLRDVLPGVGIVSRAVDTSSVDAVARAIDHRTAAVLLESPGSWLLKVPDIRAISEVAHGNQAKVVVDGTHATALLQRPLQFGADLAVYSASGMLNGHGDIIAGVICGDQRTIDALRERVRNEMGACVSPFDAWLLSRSLATLPLRIQQMCASALAVAEFLSTASGVARVLYPTLGSHPDVATARRQLTAGGSIVVFQLVDEASVPKFIDALQLCVLAVGIGGPLTTVFPPALAYPKAASSELRERGIDAKMIRLAVGLEAIDDILADLKSGLAAT